MCVRGQRNYMLAGELHFLGWSRDDRVAYVIEHSPEASDTATAQLMIQNVITDKTTAALKWDHENPFARSIAIRRALRRHKISSEGYRVDPSRQTPLRPFPIRLSDGSTIRVKREGSYHLSDAFHEGERFVTHMRLKLTKTQAHRTRQKTVYNHDFGAYGYFDMVVLGYIPSPWTDRILIVLGEVYRGWEGPPNVLSYVLVGASLSKGF